MAMAMHCSKRVSLRRLATISPKNSQIIVSRPSSSAAAHATIPRSRSAHTIIPKIQRTQQSDIPSAQILSRLCIFGLYRAPEEGCEAEEELSVHLALRDREAWRGQRLGLQDERDDGGMVTRVPVGEVDEGGGTSGEEFEREGSGDVTDT